jgi:hypothetical protein
MTFDQGFSSGTPTTNFRDKMEYQQRLLDTINILTEDHIQDILTLNEMKELLNCEHHIEDDMRRFLQETYDLRLQEQNEEQNNLKDVENFIEK